MATKKKTEIVTGLIEDDSWSVFERFLGDSVKEAKAAGISIAAIGAADGDTAVGAISGYVDEDGTFDILSFYVAPKYRKMGVGTALLEALKTVAADRKVPLRLAFCEGDAEADTLLAFMKAGGYKETDRGERLHHFTVGSLKNKVYFPAKYKNSHVRSFEELSNAEIKKIAVKTAERHRDMPEEGFTSPHVNKSCSFAYYKKGIVRGYLVCDDTAGGEVTVSALFAKDKYAMAGVLRAFASAVKAAYKAPTVIVMPVPTDRYDGLFDKLFPGVKNFEHNFEI